MSAQAQSLIAEHAPLTPRARLEVYAEMYWLRMRDVLRDGFPAVRATLGDELFDANVADFLRAHPSTHYSLDRLGKPFPAFLKSDLAALEWARAESFISIDGPVIDFSELQAIAPEAWGEVSLKAHPSVRVLELQSDPLPSVRAQRDGLPIPEPVATPTSVVTWRNGHVAFHAAVAEREASALRVLLAGGTVPELLAPFEDLDDGGVAAFEALRSWFSEGMVSQLGSATSRDERAD